MLAPQIFGLCLLALPLVGSAPPHDPSQQPQPAAGSPGRTRRHEALLELRRQAVGHYQAGRYEEAASLFTKLQTAAEQAGESELAARTLANLGACAFAQHRYQKAVEYFLAARPKAAAAGDTSAVALCDANLASLYGALNDPSGAAQWVESAIKRLSGADRARHLAELEIQLGALRSEQGRTDEALELFRKGIGDADGKGDLELYALGWNRWGEALLERGSREEAEAALLEAYRVRRLQGFPMASSYRSLGRLYLEEGHLGTAAMLLNRAVELAAQPDGPVPGWDLYHYRGIVRMEQGNLTGALDDLRAARRLARAWRWEIPANDAARVGSESMVAAVHGALIEAGNRLCLETHDPALATETLEAAEEIRSNSLRALAASDRSAGFPPSYWQAVGLLQKAELEALRNPTPATHNAAQAARGEMSRMEASIAGSARPDGAPVLGRLRLALKEDTALFSFSVGEARSWLWAVDRGEIQVVALPGEAELEARVQAALRAIETGGGTGPLAQLFDTLFGQVEARFRGKSHWLLALDGPLFGAPVPALRERWAGSERWVVERHLIEEIPGAAFWLEAGARPAAPPGGGFLGVGDPVYNLADSRVVATGQGAPAGPGNGGTGLVLPRLAASGPELDACARQWQGPSVLLKGTDATRSRLLAELARGPEVLHFATHIVQASGKGGLGMIALSTARARAAELLTPQEIAHWHTTVGTVVISGCHSAGAAAIPATGLVGLTRAWLAAGAEAVVASRWETPDEPGAMFAALYRSLAAKRGTQAARALRNAQLEMLHAADWRAQPRYWGAWFAVGHRGGA